MLYRALPERRRCRRGAATPELAILAPLLCFLFVIALDFGRVFYYSITVSNCGRNAALGGSIDQTHSKSSNWDAIKQTALNDASTLSPALTTSSVTVSNDSDTSPTWLQVSVTYQFQSILNFSIPNLFIVPSSLTMTRTIRMSVPPNAPVFN